MDGRLGGNGWGGEGDSIQRRGGRECVDGENKYGGKLARQTQKGMKREFTDRKDLNVL